MTISLPTWLVWGVGILGGAGVVIFALLGLAFVIAFRNWRFM